LGKQRNFVALTLLLLQTFFIAALLAMQYQRALVRLGMVI
jgi:putative Ca2+/H+ antiporter (TMEM165/GDT1 family)